MKIVEYRGACDVDIMFEDGVINQHKAMKQFRSGQIGHPHIGTNSDGNFHGVKTQRGFSTEHDVITSAHSLTEQKIFAHLLRLWNIWASNGHFKGDQL